MLNQITIQNSMIFQLNDLSTSAHKILIGLLAQVPDPITGLAQVTVKDLYQTLNPLKDKEEKPKTREISGQFRKSISPALQELDTPVRIIVSSKWAGWKRLLSKKLVTHTALNDFESTLPDTIIVPLSDDEWLIDGSLLPMASVQSGKITAKFNPILLEFFTSNERSYTKIYPHTCGLLKKRLSLRLFELIPAFKGIAQAQQSNVFEWHWKGVTDKVPSVLDAFPASTTADYNHFFNDSLKPALDELVKLGIIKSWSRTFAKNHRAKAILLTFDNIEQSAQHPGADTYQSLENVILPF